MLDANGRTWLDPILRPLERLTYQFLGVRPGQEQDWRRYTLAMLLFSLVSCLFTYAVLRLQHLLPLNPQGLGAVSPDLAFNTAISFTTNTNWQSYSGESSLSYLSQMVALVLHNFASAAVGIGLAAALVRGVARHSTHSLGNFWVDLVRTTYYLLLPLCLMFALVLVSQGMIQNFSPYTKAHLLEPFKISVEKKTDAGATLLGTDGKPTMEEQTVDEQIIAQGPMASQVAIKMLGTNGGGFTNANAAHPFENPTPLSNFLQMLSIFAIGSGLTYYLGRMTHNQAHGWSVWGAMMSLFLAGTLICWWAEASGNPIHQHLGVEALDGNMEGKEVRFGIFNSALFATVTTDASCGAVNAMHDSFTALGGLVPLFNIELGEVVIGGVGSGLYGMIVFVVLAVFISGLMVGRTPEYLGKKIQAYDVKNPVMFVTLVGAALTTLGIFTSAADRGFILQLALWLWFTVLFANFAEAVAEGRGKAQAQALRRTQTHTSAHRLGKDGTLQEVEANSLRKADLILVRAGEIIPSDGDVVEGAATVDESAITGESAPVMSDSHHHRGTAERDRDRGYGSTAPAERARDERAGRRGCGRCRCFAPR